MRHVTSLRALLRPASITVVGLAIAATTIATSPVEPEYDGGGPRAIEDAAVIRGWSAPFRLEGAVEAGETEIGIRLDVTGEVLGAATEGQLGVRLESADPEATIAIRDAAGADLVLRESGATTASDADGYATMAIVDLEELSSRCEAAGASGDCAIELTVAVTSAEPATWSVQGALAAPDSVYTEPAGRVTITQVP